MFLGASVAMKRSILDQTDTRAFVANLCYSEFLAQTFF
jgi:hypothetical protein